MKLLKEKRQQELELNNRIKELSTFDSKLIGDIIAKLMSKFEGILYQCAKNNSWFGDYDYLVEPKNREKDYPQIYPNYMLKKETNNFIFSTEEKKSLTFLPPASFMSNNTFDKEYKDINISYIQYFIDFLYEKRSNNLLYNISSDNLEIILQEFLLITKDLQQQRKEEIAKKIEERLCHKKRLEFEDSCMIDRKLIYNALTYIINHYEENIIATQEYKDDCSRSSQWSEFYAYHNLIIQYDSNKICFETQVDHDGCYPDEEYCGVSINFNKDTNICFFDLKKTINPIINNCVFVEKFMNMVENLYNENMNISLDDIQQILIIISNDRKASKKVLQKVKFPIKTIFN